MKLILFSILFLMIKPLNGQESEGLLTVNNFVKNVLVDSSFSMDDLDNYVTLSKDSSKNEREKILWLIKTNIEELRMSLNTCTKNYSVTHHHNITKEIISTYKLDYSDYSNVYYLICNGKIITPIILRNAKVISFFTTLRKTENQPYKPWLLN